MVLFLCQLDSCSSKRYIVTRSNMFENPLDIVNKEEIKKAFSAFEKLVDADVLVYRGEFGVGIDKPIKGLIEDLSLDKPHERLVILLTTNGGALEPVIRIVNTIRHFYQKVDFYVPDYAYSAGTIFCCSGDRIFMDYNSVLGPIDPQVQTKDNKWVAALGYLDKIKELIDKSNKGTLSQAEFLILKDFDLAELRHYEQERDLTIDLLEKWLPKYKFASWITHKDGKTVTLEEKIKRANEIATSLSNNNIWKSHGRPINREELRDLKLKIDACEDQPEIYQAMKKYHELMEDYVRKYNLSTFAQTRRFV